MVRRMTGMSKGIVWEKLREFIARCVGNTKRGKGQKTCAVSIRVPSQSLPV